MFYYINITNKKFGRLTAIKKTNKRKSGSIVWLCKCDCGNLKEASYSKLKYNYVKSCGCLWGKNEKHGFTRTRFYNIWRHLKYRCTKPKNKDYKNYGGRGIKICDRWLDFGNFRDDMYVEYCDHILHFNEKNTTIERINNDGNYEPSNCKWATISEQNRNKRPNKRNKKGRFIKSS